MSERLTSDNSKQKENQTVQIIEENSENIRKMQANYESEQIKKQEARMMTYFNQEFIERKIDFKPK
jgi:hypothetical protein